MNEALPFQRARKPEEQKLRRDAILKAAAELFDAQGVQGAGLNAIAARAGFTKSNVYRYFESREEVLMNLFLGEFEAFVGDFESGVMDCAPGDIEKLSAAATQAFIAHPRFCALIGILSGVLEQNVSVDKIIALKRNVTVLYGRVTMALATRLPGTSIEDCGWAAGITATLVGGMWPNVTPSSAAATVVAMPEFAHMKPVPERDIARAMSALLRSIVR